MQLPKDIKMVSVKDLMRKRGMQKETDDVLNIMKRTQDQVN